MGPRAIILSEMKPRAQTVLLSAAALFSLAEVFLAPRTSDPGPWAGVILAILLFRRAIVATRQPIVVILSGCLLTTLLVAGNHGLLNVNQPVWLSLVVLAGICYAFWEKIERLWME